MKKLAFGLAVFLLCTGVKAEDFQTVNTKFNFFQSSLLITNLGMEKLKSPFREIVPFLAIGLNIGAAAIITPNNENDALKWGLLGVGAGFLINIKF